MRKILLFVFLHLIVITVAAQRDYGFWIAPPGIYMGKDSCDRPVRLHVSSLSNNLMRVVVEMPANPNIPLFTGYILPHGSISIDLEPELINSLPERIGNNGIYVDVPDVAYAFYEIGAEGNADIYPLKGSNAEGLRFIVPWQNEYSNDTIGSGNFISDLGPYPPRQRIDILATEKTDITITPSNDLFAFKIGPYGPFHPAGSSFSVPLNKGQTYSIMANSLDYGKHLGGTEIISSSANIVVSVSDDLLHNEKYNTSNLVGEQIIPNERLGLSYIALKGLLTDSDQEKIYVTATENHTYIYEEGNPVAVDTIMKGETYEINFPQGEDAIYFKANKPISTFQVSGIGNYLAGAQIPPIPCNGYKTVKYQRTNDDTLVLNIYVQDGGQDDFILNGNSTFINASDFSVVLGTNNIWYHASIGVPNTFLASEQTLTIENESLYHLSVLEGGDIRKDARFGYLTRYDQSIKLKPTTNHEKRGNIFCEGDTISLFLKDYTNLVDVEWSGPKNFYDKADSTKIPDVDTSHSGWYSVKARTINLCDVFFDSVEVKAFMYPIMDLGDDRSLCEGAITFTVDSIPGVGYLWSTGNDSTVSITVDTPGKYWVRANNHGCIDSDTAIVSPEFIPALTILSNGDLCEDQKVELYAQTTVPGFLWSTGETTQQITVTDTGWYKVQVNYFNCTKVDSIRVDERIPILQITEDGELCDKGVKLKADGDAWTFIWNTRETTQEIVANNPGKYWVQANINQCVNSDTIEILPYIPPRVNILQSGDLCDKGVTLEFDSEYDATNILWSTGEITEKILVDKYGKYWVRVYMNNCVNTDTIEILEIKPPLVITRTGNMCEDGILTLEAQANADSYLWSTGETTKKITINNFGKYWVDILKNKCMNSDTIDIEKVVPDLEIISKGGLCENGVVTLEAITDGTSYLWSTGETTKQISVDKEGKYWVEVSMNNCTNSDTIKVTKEGFDLNLTTQRDICLDGYVIIKTETNVVPDIYYWSTGENDIDKIVVDRFGKYWVEVHINDCVNSDTIDIVEIKPEIKISQEGDLCQNKSLLLKVETDALNILWSTGEITPEINITKAGKYWITVYSNLCTNSDTIEYDIKQPIARYSSDINPLGGCEPLNIHFKDSSEDAVTYLWDFGDGKTSNEKDPFHQYSRGIYKLIFYAYSSEGCMDSIMSDVYVFHSPKPDFYWFPTYPTVKEPKTYFYNKTTPHQNNSNYLWKLQIDKDDPEKITTIQDSIDLFFQWDEFVSSPVFGVYSVELRVALQNIGDDNVVYECADSISYRIRILNDFLQFPNVITPNGDGINDVFKIINLVEGLAYPNNELVIYDRVGKKVFHKKDIKIDSDFWDPNVTNTPPGTYYYRFVGKGYFKDIEYSGAIEILRK